MCSKTLPHHASVSTLILLGRERKREDGGRVGFMCVCERTRRGRGLSVRVDLTGVFIEGDICVSERKELERELSVLVECVLKGHSVKYLGG